MSTSVSASDIEPRSYANLPKNLNILVAGYANVRGNVAFSPALPIKDAQLETHTAVFGYSRTLDLWGKSGKVDLIFPAAWLSGTAKVSGQDKTREITGFTDSIMRLYVNLYGAPALTVKEFAKYKQDTIVGVSLAVIAPSGQYDVEKLINLGNNRWAIKPEIGISKAFGPVSAEFSAAMYNYTNNNQPFHGNTLEQKPLYNFQGHLIYSFGRGIWAAADANYYMGGRTTMDGIQSDNMQQNWRVGGSFSMPLSKHISFKVYGNTGVYSRTGSGFDLIGINWLYIWGDGL